MADLLVVDNDARIAELVAWFLEKGGHSACVVTSYAQAREALRERRFALMLADLELGAEDGRVELPLLESEGLLPLTLVVSGYLDAEITEALFKIPGVLGAVPKPFEPRELLERVDAVLAEAPERAPVSDPESAPAPEEEASSESAELEEFVILAKPAPQASDPAQPAPTGESVEEEWVEIVPEEQVDTSDWEGAG
jgi:DNA-binding response OmpR family regulator